MHEHPMSLPIKRVQLSEDRAEVQRTGRLSLPIGLARIVVEDVAPVVVDKSLSVVCDGGNVLTTQVRRRRTAHPDDHPPEVRALHERIRAVNTDVQKVRQDLGFVDEQLAFLHALADRGAQEIAEDVSWGRADPSAWTQQWRAPDQSQVGLLEQRTKLHARLRDLEQLLGDLQEQAAYADNPRQEVLATLVLDIEVTTENPTVDIRYIVPGACWRPAHRAVLKEGHDSVVVWQTLACVWQSTGEDWEGVGLTFSTHRPSMGVTVPTLHTDRVQSHRVSKTVEVTTREQEVQDTGDGAAVRVVHELPGIDDGGESITIEAQALHGVRSDGRMHHVPLGEFRVPVTPELVAMPELAPAVMLTSRLHNPTALPLLPGPVALIRGGGLVGRTPLSYTAPGEKFRLGWGPVPEVRLVREVEEGDEDGSMFSGWKRTKTTTTVKLTNLGSDPLNLEITERVPVSEIDKVKIEVDAKKTSGRQQPDGDGFVRWQVKLDPRGRTSRKLVWTLARKSNVEGT